ncbi:MAG: response regulator transcription factor [Chloroflexi bacterium]|nr:response regulator transcription factor [Chloroflexota bacterium]
MKKETILVVDDDPAISHVLTVLLEEEGFVPIHARDGVECLRLAYNCQPDLILLDILLPIKDGRELCRELRLMSAVPIMMMTALGGDKEKVARLNDGADDYITKPFSNSELIARIRAILRRAHQAAGLGARVYQDERILIDFEGHKLLVRNKSVELTPTEWRVLEYLVRHAGRAVSRQALLKHGWGDGVENTFSYLKVVISHLRKKLGETPHRPRYIFTEREQGYRFEKHA